MSPKKEEKSADEIAREKNGELWVSLFRVGLPLAIVSFTAMIVPWLRMTYHSHLLEAMVTSPLALVCVASWKHMGSSDWKGIFNDLAFHFCKGLIISAALGLGGPSSVLFERMNAGVLGGSFDGNLVSAELGFTLRTLVFYKTIDSTLNPYLVDMFLR